MSRVGLETVFEYLENCDLAFVPFSHISMPLGNDGHKASWGSVDPSVMNDYTQFLSQAAERDARLGEEDTFQRQLQPSQTLDSWMNGAMGHNVGGGEQNYLDVPGQNLDTESYSASPFVSGNEDNDDLISGTFQLQNDFQLQDDLQSLLDDDDLRSISLSINGGDEEMGERNDISPAIALPVPRISNEVPVPFQIPTLSHTTSNFTVPLTPSIIVSPAEHAKRTPSLFSSRSNSRSRSGSRGPAPVIQVEDTEELRGDLSNPYALQAFASSVPVLSLPAHENLRRGRQRRHSQGRSRSASVSSQITSSEFEEGEDDEADEEDYDDGDTSEGTAKYICEACGKEFNRPYNLKSHLRTHTKERPYSCRKCGKTFARQHDRKRHEDLHSGEKKYQCRGQLANGVWWGCGKRFARPDALRRHFCTDSGRGCTNACIVEILGKGSGKEWEAAGVKVAMQRASELRKRA